MNKAYFYGLRTRLILLVIIAVVPSLGLILYNASEQRQAAINDITENTVRLAQLATIDEEHLIAGTRQLLVALANMYKMVCKDSTVYNEFLANLMAQYRVYSNLGAVKTDGSLCCSALPINEPVNLADRDYFQRTIRTREFSVGNYQIDRINGEATINFGYPVLNEHGKIQAIVFAAVSLNKLDKFEFEIQKQLPQRSILSKLDRNGIIVVHYPDSKKWIGSQIPDELFAKTIIEQKKGILESSIWDGINRIYAFTTMHSPVNPGDVYVILGIEKEIAFRFANRNLLRNLVLLGLVSLLALAAAWFGGDFFIRRKVNKLLTTTKRIETGDFKVRMGVKHEHGELDQLSIAFDKMAEKLELREREKDIAEKKIRASLQEKELLLREVNHRVRNNLQIISSLLNLQSGRNNDQNSIHQFRAFKNRIQSMALVHEKLYESQDFANIDFDEYIPSLTKVLYESFGKDPEKIEIVVKVENGLMGIDKAIPCGMIINELVSNSLQHAFPTTWEGEARIEIILHRVSKHTIELIVRDNGIGLPKDINFIKAESLGFLLVTVSAKEELDGDITLKGEEGTEFKIVFDN